MHAAPATFAAPHAPARHLAKGAAPAKSLAPLVTTAAGGLLLLLAILAAGHAQASAVIGTSDLWLGIDDYGHLGVVDQSNPMFSTNCGVNYVAMQSVNNGWEAQDCDHEGEGWGLAYVDANGNQEEGDAVYKWTTQIIGGSAAFKSFSSTATKAESVVTIGADVELHQKFEPTSKTQYLYADKITIKNVGPKRITDVDFRRVMTWGKAESRSDWTCNIITELKPLPANSALQGTYIMQLSNYLSPLTAPAAEYGGTLWEGPPTNHDDQTWCYDLGNQWDFHLKGIDAGGSVTMTLYYGGGPDKATAEAAARAVDAYVAAFDTHDNEPWDVPFASNDGSHGDPWVWVMAFADIPDHNGTSKIDPVQPPVDPPQPPSYDQGTPADPLPPSHPLNDFPVVRGMPHITVEVGKPVTFTVSAIDTEFDTLHLNALRIPAGAYVEPFEDHLVFTWTPGPNDIGMHCGIRFAVTEFLVDAVDSNPGTPHSYDQTGFGETCINVFDRDSDNDRDGVQDGADDCPGVPDREQHDADNDKFGDVCDVCPNVSDPNQSDIDGDGVGDACPELIVKDSGKAAGKPGDQDGDGVADASDNCPKVANLDQKDLDGDNLGDVCDADADNDGALNYSPDKLTILDNCPDVANGDQKDTNGDHSGDACPQGQTVPVMGSTKVSTSSGNGSGQAPVQPAKSNVNAQPTGKKASGVAIMGILAVAGAAVVLRRKDE